MRRIVFVYLLILLALLPLRAMAVPVVPPSGGGTGNVNPQGILKGNGPSTPVSSASPGIDYMAPGNVQAQSATYATDTGTANAYVIAPSPAITSYVAGQQFTFIAGNTNTGASTLAVSGLGALPITATNLFPIAPGMVVAGQVVRVQYDGTKFQLAQTGPTVITNAPTNILGAGTAYYPVSLGGDVCIDTVNNELYESQTIGGPNYQVFSRTASGNSPPLRTVEGAATTIGNITGLSVDTVNNEIAIRSTNSILIFARNATGNATPLRSITGLPAAQGGNAIVDDPVNNLIWTTSATSILAYSRTATGAATAVTTISGSSTTFVRLFGITLDLVNGNVLVIDYSAGVVDIFPLSANGNVAPSQSFSNSLGFAGPARTGAWYSPTGIAVDPVNTNQIFVGSLFSGVTSFPINASGSVTPTYQIGGSVGGNTIPISVPGFTANSGGSNTVAVDTVNNEVWIGGIYGAPSGFLAAANASTGATNRIIWGVYPTGTGQYYGGVCPDTIYGGWCQTNPWLQIFSTNDGTASSIFQVVPGSSVTQFDGFVFTTSAYSVTTTATVSIAPGGGASDANINLKLSGAGTGNVQIPSSLTVTPPTSSASPSLTTGAETSYSALTFTDNSSLTSQTGFSANTFAAPVLKSTTGTLTGIAATVYIGGPPTASTNETITTPYSIDVASGTTNLQAVNVTTLSAQPGNYLTINSANPLMNGPVGIAVDNTNNNIIECDFTGNAICVYTRTAAGNISPVRRIVGPATTLNGPKGVSVDTVNNEIDVANLTGDSILVFSRTANGNVAPLRTISGAATLMTAPHSIAVDTTNNELVVSDQTNNAIYAFSRTATGNTAPLRSLVGAATTLSGPRQLYDDTVNNEIGVINLTGQAITVFNRTDSGNTAPIRTISGASTSLGTGCDAIAVDTTNNEIVVGDFSPATIEVYSRTANGNVAPLRTISGGSTTLNDPQSVYDDTTNNEIGETEFNNNQIVVFARTASGNVAPLRAIAPGLSVVVNGVIVSSAGALSAPSLSLTTALPTTSGGLGSSITPTVGGIPTGSSPTTYGTNLADVVVGEPLVSGGVNTAPAYSTSANGLTSATGLVSVGTLTTGTWNATTVATAHGGTGLTGGTTGYLPYWASSSALSNLTIGSTGQFLQVSGGLPAWATTLGVANGGTGLTTMTVGGLLYPSASTTLTQLADVATGSVLVSGGVTTAPAYSSSPTLSTSLTVPTLDGGTASAGGLAINSTTNATLGPITLGGGVRLNVVSKSSAATLNTGNCVVTVTATATMSLPAATGSGQEYQIYDSAGTTSIAPNGTDQINGSNTTLTMGGAGTTEILVDVASGKWSAK